MTSFYKTPEPEIYKRTAEMRAQPLSQHDAQCAAAKTRNANLVKTHEPSLEEQNRRKTKQKIMEHDQMAKTHYRWIYDADTTKNIDTDAIMRSTLNASFMNTSIDCDSNEVTPTHGSLRATPIMLRTSPDELQQKSVQRVESPFARQTVKKHEVKSEAKPKRKMVIKTTKNFHQTPLDAFPFRNGLQKNGQARRGSVPRTKEEFLKRLADGDNCVSYWAG